MIPWLDFKIFGGGYGMSVPFSDNRFYWLVDTHNRDRDGKHGEFYTFMHGLGAQLHSYQWFHPKAGEARELCGRRFRPFHSSRRWFRVEVAWATHLPCGIDEANAELRQLEKELGRP